MCRPALLAALECALPLSLATVRMPARRGPRLRTVGGHTANRLPNTRFTCAAPPQFEVDISVRRARSAGEEATPQQSRRGSRGTEVSGVHSVAERASGRPKRLDVRPSTAHALSMESRPRPMEWEDGHRTPPNPTDGASVRRPHRIRGLRIRLAGVGRGRRSLVQAGEEDAARAYLRSRLDTRRPGRRSPTGQAPQPPHRTNPGTAARSCACAKDRRAWGTAPRPASPENQRTSESAGEANANAPASRRWHRAADLDQVRLVRV